MSYLLAKYNTATDFYFPMVKRGVVDLAVTGDWTPATGDTKVSKDGGAVANSTNNPAIASGVSWKLTITATELSCKWLTVQIVDSATKAVEDQFITILTYGNASAFFIAPDYQDAVRFGLTALPNAAAEAAGGLYTRGSGAGQINQNNNGNVDVNAVRINAVATTSVTTVNANVGSTQPVNFTGTAGSALVKGDAVDLAGTALTGRDIGASVLISSGSGAGQLDVTSGVIKANLAQILGTALTETAGQIAAAFKQFFNIASPTSTMNTITTVTTATNLTTNNDKTGYALSAGGVTAVQSGLATSASLATVQADTDDIQTRLPAALSGGRMDSVVNAMAAGVVTAAAVATNAIDADALAADAVTEIAAGVAVGSAPTAAQNAAAVWDLNISGHTTSGTFGNKVNGLTSGGSGGPVGSGSTAYTVTVTQPDNVTPIEGVAVWVSTDVAGTNVVAGTLYTDTLGRINTTVGFMLDPGAYYLWRQHSDWTFANPTSFTVT